MALKCYFQQLLSYKYLLFFFSSFPPGEKGRGPIENSALSLSVGFKYRSNNRSLLLFFLSFLSFVWPDQQRRGTGRGQLPPPVRAARRARVHAASWAGAVRTRRARVCVHPLHAPGTA